LGLVLRTSSETERRSDILFEGVILHGGIFSHMASLIRNRLDSEGQDEKVIGDYCCGDKQGRPSFEGLLVLSLAQENQDSCSDQGGEEEEDQVHYQVPLLLHVVFLEVELFHLII